ncbi:MAG: hypothetical protein AB8F78_11545 [Saprospiraceae bacterium]
MIACALVIGCEPDEVREPEQEETNSETSYNCDREIQFQYENIIIPEENTLGFGYDVVQTNNHKYLLVYYTAPSSSDGVHARIFELNNNGTSTLLYNLQGVEFAGRTFTGSNDDHEPRIYRYGSDNLILASGFGLFYLDCINRVAPENLFPDAEGVFIHDVDVSFNGSIAVIGLFADSTDGIFGVMYTQNRLSRFKKAQLELSDFPDPSYYGDLRIRFNAQATSMYVTSSVLDGLSYQIYKANLNAPPEYIKLRSHPTRRRARTVSRKSAASSRSGAYFYQAYVFGDVNYDSMFIFKSDLLGEVLDTNFYIGRVDASERFTLESVASPYAITMSNRYIGFFDSNRGVKRYSNIEEFYCTNGRLTVLNDNCWQGYYFDISNDINNGPRTLKVSERRKVCN